MDGVDGSLQSLLVPGTKEKTCRYDTDVMGNEQRKHKMYDVLAQTGTARAGAALARMAGPP